MKQFILTITAIFLFTFCANQPEKVEKTKDQITIENTQKDVDSIEKRYDQIKTFMELGLTAEQAERAMDSINDVVKKASRGE